MFLFLFLSTSQTMQRHEGTSWLNAATWKIIQASSDNGRSQTIVGQLRLDHMANCLCFHVALCSLRRCFDSDLVRGVVNRLAFRWVSDGVRPRVSDDIAPRLDCLVDRMLFPRFHLFPPPNTHLQQPNMSHACKWNRRMKRNTWTLKRAWTKEIRRQSILFCSRTWQPWCWRTSVGEHAT